MGRCPSTEQLQQLLDRQPDAAERTAIETHVEDCPSCQEQLARLTDDEAVREWREMLRPRSPTRGGKIEEDAFEAIKQAPPRFMEETGGGGAKSSDSMSINFPDPPTEMGPLGRLATYHIQQELGSGATGIVYLAFDEQLCRSVAIKILKPEWSLSVGGRARFEREAKVAAAVSHERIVAIHQVGHVPTFPLPFLVMEFIDGESLARCLERDGAFPHRDAVRIVRQVALALNFAHERGLVHRDIKPSNIMLERISRLPKITDFGIARTLVDTDGTISGRLTHSGHLVGTPAYMSPEQIRDSQYLDGRSDIYSLGIVLYELLSGERPFRGTNHTLIQQAAHRIPQALRSLNAEIPRDLETITHKCLEEPQKRYRTGAELADDLDRWLLGKPITARRASFWERGRKWLRRNPAWAILLGVSSVSMLLLMIVSTYYTLKLHGTLRETQRAFVAVERERDAKDSLLQRTGIETAIRLRGISPRETGKALLLVPPSRRGWEWDRLTLECALGPRPLQVIGTHDWGILDGVLSSDGQTLVTSGQDGRVIRWDCQRPTHQELEPGIWQEKERSWRRATTVGSDLPTQDYYPSLCWLDDGSLVAGVSALGKVILWNLKNSERRLIFQHERTLTAIAATEDGQEILIGDDQGILFFMDRSGRNPTRLNRLQNSAIFVIASVTSSGWVIGQADGTLSLVEPDGSRILSQVKLAGPIWDIDIAPDSSLIAVACQEPSLLAFTIEPDGTLLQRSNSSSIPEVPDQTPQAIQSVRVSPDGRCIAAEDDLGRLILWKRDEHGPPVIREDQWERGLQPGTVAQLPLFLRRRAAFLAFSPDSSLLYTGGLSTAVKRWTVVGSRGLTTLSLGVDPKVCFDVADPSLLWAGIEDGTLALWDSRTGIRRHSLPAHEGPITGLDFAAQRSLLVSGSRDRSLRFWKRVNHRIEAAGRPIIHSKPLRSVAISPDGRRVAAYDTEDAVALWDVASGHLVARSSMRQTGLGSAVGGLVAFNRDGTRLTAVGPAESLWVFAAESLAILDKPYVVAGDGGTAIAWHPSDERQLAGGDTLGRILGSPLRDEQFRTTYRMPQTIVGLTFTPDGKRLAAASSDGTVYVYDPRWVDRLFTLRSDVADPTALSFNPTGQRLALVHRRGTVTIWETHSTGIEPTIRSARPWEETILLQDRHTRLRRLRSPAVSLDSQDRLWLLYAKETEDPARAAKTAVFLGRQTERGWEEDLIEDIGESDDRKAGSLERSLALLIDRDTVWAAVRRPSRGNDGQLLLTHREKQASRPRAIPSPPETLVEPANWGFDTHLFPGTAGRPLAMHFSHAGNYLLATRWSDGRWQTDTWGRQGDGLRFHAEKSHDGRIHIIFKPWRFGDDPSPLVYLRRAAGEIRETIDASIGVGGDQALAVSPDGSLAVMYSRAGENGPKELVFARRTPEGWTHDVVFDRFPWVISNLTCDRRGAYRFAYADQEGHRISMAACERFGEPWQAEVVWAEPKAEDSLSDEERDLRLVTLLDSHGKPLIVASRRSQESGWLRVFRPAK